MFNIFAGSYALQAEKDGYYVIDIKELVDQALEKKTDIRSYKEFIGILDAKINIKESKIKLEKSKHKC